MPGTTRELNNTSDFPRSTSVVGTEVVPAVKSDGTPVGIPTAQLVQDGGVSAGHIADQTNPHNVTADQIGVQSAMWQVGKPSSFSASIANNHLTISWSTFRLLSTGPLVRRIQDQAEITVEDSPGECLYIDPNESVGPDGFTVQFGLFSDYYEDFTNGTKVLLVGNYFGILMGVLAEIINTHIAKNTADDAQADAAGALDDAVPARANAKVARKKISGSAFVVERVSAFTKKVYLGPGQVWEENQGGTEAANIAPVSEVALLGARGLVIDFDNPVLDGNGHHVPQLVIIASGAETGWQEGNRHILLACDDRGNLFGEYAVNPGVGHYDGEAAFLLNGGSGLPTWEASTRTLTWPDLLFIVQEDSVGARIILEAGSITVPPDGFYTVVLDRREVVPGGTTPATAVKVGDYRSSDGSGVLVGANLVYLPLFASGRGGLAYPLRFPPTIGAVGGPGEITAGTYESSELVVLAGTDQVDIHAKGGDSVSNKYIRSRMAHKINAPQGGDVWRLERISDALRTGDASFTSGIELTTSGMQEMAIRFNGKPTTEPGLSDWIGGDVHGDEELFFAQMLIDGVEQSLGTAANFRARVVEFFQGSNVWEPSTNQATLAAKSYKRWRFEKDTLELSQHLVWEGAYDLADTYLTMLSWLRDNGAVAVSDKGYRSPFFEEEDISLSGFTPIYTDSKIAKASGAGGYSAEIEILEGWDKTGRTFNFSNATAYNKFYFDYVPNGYVTSPGEIFQIRSRYKIGNRN